MTMLRYAVENGIVYNTFRDWVCGKNKKQRKLDPTDAPLNVARKRQRNSAFHEVEVELIKYINVHKEMHDNSTAGLSWVILHDLALQIAKKHLQEPELSKFRASNGFISNVLKRHNLAKLTGRSASTVHVPRNVITTSSVDDIDNIETHEVDITSVNAATVPDVDADDKTKTENL